MSLHNQGLVMTTEHNPTDLPNSMTAIIHTGHPRISRLRIPTSPRNRMRGSKKCLHHRVRYRPALHRRRTAATSSVSHSRLPSRLLWPFQNQKYPPSSTLLRPGFPNNHNRAMTETATEESCRGTYLPRQLQPGRATMLNTDKRRILDNSVPSHRSPGHGWSRRP